MTKRNSIYDTARVPVNYNAARSMSGGYSHQHRLKPSNHTEWDFCPELDKVTSRGDLTGLSKGRLTVVGKLKSSTKWVCRCACGKFVLRNAKKIKLAQYHQNANIDACRVCCHLAFLKRNEHWRRTGKDITHEEAMR